MKKKSIQNIFILGLLVLFSSCQQEEIEPNEPTPLPPVANIGDNYQGGIVVYLTEDGQHGLIITDFDVDTCEWSNGPMTFTAMNSNDYYNAYGISDSDIGAGKYNTQIIIDSFGTNGINYAAQVCNDLVHGGYNDWFLPSREEIRKAYYSGIFPTDGIGLDNGAEPGYYWTSNGGQSGGGYAIIHRMYPWLAQSSMGQTTYPIYGQPANPHKVRAMREF